MREGKIIKSEDELVKVVKKKLSNRGYDVSNTTTYSSSDCHTDKFTMSLRTYLGVTKGYIDSKLTEKYQKAEKEMMLKVMNKGSDSFKLEGKKVKLRLTDSKLHITLAVKVKH